MAIACAALKIVAVFTSYSYPRTILPRLSRKLNEEDGNCQWPFIPFSQMCMQPNVYLVHKLVWSPFLVSDLNCW